MRESFNSEYLPSRVSVVAFTGAPITIEDASAADTIRSVKQRVYAANRGLHVRRQRLMYRPGPRGIEPLADNETLGGAGVAQDGTAVIDVLLVDLSVADKMKLGPKVWCCARSCLHSIVYRIVFDVISCRISSVWLTASSTLQYIIIFMIVWRNEWGGFVV